MIGYLYRKVWKSLQQTFWLLLGIFALACVLIDIGIVLGGPIVGIGLCASALLGTAMRMVFLRCYRGEEIHCLQLFDCFRDWKIIKRILCGVGWQTLWILLWSAIPVVGIVFGIIRGYEYSLTPYLLMENPEIKPTQAIEISKEKTNGYKAKMFWADMLYGAITVFGLLVLFALGMIEGVGAVFAVLFVFALVIAILFVPLFAGLLRAAFYEEIVNPTVCGKDGNFFCSNCGKPLREGAAFCGNCGKKV